MTEKAEKADTREERGPGTKRKSGSVPNHEIEAIVRFSQEFSKESDRAAVILGAAKLDLLLFQLLQNALRPCTSRNDELLEGDSPLGTFSARSMMCFRLGLIDEELFRAINFVRKIRNTFAHDLSGVSLTSGAQRDRIKELCAGLERSKAFHQLRASLARGSEIDPAINFRAAVTLLIARLERAVHSTRRIFSSTPTRLISNG